MGGRDDRFLAGDFVLAACVTEKLTASGADPIFAVSISTRAAVGVNGGMVLHGVGMVEFGNASRFRMSVVPLAGSRFAPLRLLRGGGRDDPITPLVAGGGDPLRFRIVALSAGKSIYAIFRAGGLSGHYAIVPFVPQCWQGRLRGEHRIAHRAVLSLGQTGLRTGGGNGGINDPLVPRGRDGLRFPRDFRIAHHAANHFFMAAVRRTGRGDIVFNRRRTAGVPRGRDHRLIGFRVTTGTVSAFTAVFGAGGELVLGKVRSIGMPQLVCGDHIFLRLRGKGRVLKACRVSG